jgi:hypothetical protein
MSLSNYMLLHGELKRCLLLDGFHPFNFFGALNKDREFKWMWTSDLNLFPLFCMYVCWGGGGGGGGVIHVFQHVL